MVTQGGKCPSCGALFGSEEEIRAPAEPEAPTYSVPEDAVVRAHTIINDAMTSIVVGFLVITWPWCVMRLVQWHRLSRQFPFLASGDAGNYSELAHKFRLARIMLWIAVVLPPVVVAGLYCFERFG